jgi:hypothetical protein
MVGSVGWLEVPCPVPDLCPETAALHDGKVQPGAV